MLDALNNIRIVLVHTSHPGNIGAAARAMKTMGLSRLYLVQPKLFPDAAATARATGAEEILTNAQVVDTLAAALADCQLVIGSSARARYLTWPALAITDLGARTVQAAQGGQVALVFGRERTGLTNLEMQLCHYQVTIPANPAFSSLNLAAAVQLMAYEIYAHYCACGDHIISPAEVPDLATTAELAGLYEHLSQLLVQIEHLDLQRPRQIMARLRRLYNRAQLEKVEVNILRGILTATQKKLKV